MCSDCKVSGRNVLIVENEYFLADDMANTMKEMGAIVVGPFPNTEKVIDLKLIDLALLDVKLDEESDIYPFAWRLRLANIPFIFVTGYDKKAIKEEFRDTPMIRKDEFCPDTLSLSIKQLMCCNP